MSSWNRPVSRQSLPITKLYCLTSKSGYGSNFLNYFMCYLYAKAKGDILYIRDTVNNVSSTYHIILDTFHKPAFVQYTDIKGVPIQSLHITDAISVLHSYTLDTLRDEATIAFQWKESVQKEIDSRKPKAMGQFDVGIHIRTGDKITSGEMNAISLDRYIHALQAYQGSKESLDIFLMTDNSSIKGALQAANSSWTLHTIDHPVLSETGHIQNDFNQLPTPVKKEEFLLFLAELDTMASCQHIICTFSSNIGRFLQFTCSGTIESLDSYKGHVNVYL